MSTTTIIFIGVLASFAALIIISRRRMKNMANVKTSDKIVTLNQKNFKKQTRSGLTLVDFWAPWCGPCKMMAPILNDVAEHVDDDISIAKLNIDHHPQISGKEKVRSIPTLVLYRDGQEINRFVGIKSKKFLLKELAKVQ